MKSKFNREKVLSISNISIVKTQNQDSSDQVLISARESRGIANFAHSRFKSQDLKNIG